MKKNQEQEQEQDHNLIKQIYLSNDPDLLKVVSKYFPVPPVSFFEEKTAPQYIREREMKTNEHISGFLHKNRTESYTSVENKVMQIQRLYRKKKKQTLEELRIEKEIANNKFVVEDKKTD